MDENTNYLKMIAPVEETNISSKNYVTDAYPYSRGNRYLIYNNILYKVIKTINIGDELIYGENIVPTTVMGEIENLWHQINANNQRDLGRYLGFY